MRTKKKSLVAQETQEFLEGQGLPPIHLLLAAVAAGYDPRKGPTNLQNMVKKLGWERPSREQWLEIREEIEENPMFAHEQVGLSDSMTAMVQLMKYIQPQLKSVEMEAVIEDNTEVSRFNQADREEFKEFFMKEFGEQVVRA